MHIKRKIILSIIFSFFSLNLLFAAGQSEEKLAEIDALIEAKNYNHALVLIEALLKRDPNEFDNAQIRIKKIFEYKNDFTGFAETLVDIILTDPTNTSGQIQLLDKLESMEENIDEQTKEFFAQTRRIAEFTFVRANFERIMKTSQEFIKRKRYLDSAKYIVENFDLNRDDLKTYNLPNIKINDIDKKIDTVKNHMTAYANVQSVIINSVARFNSAVRQNRIDQARTIFTDEIEPAFKKVAAFSSEIASIASFFYTEYNILAAQSSALNQNSYFYMMYQFMAGKDQTSLSGILGTIEAQWLELSNSMKTTLANAVEPRWERIIKSMEDKGALTYPAVHTVAKRLLPEAEKFASLGFNVNNLNTLKKYNYPGITSNIYTEFSIGMKAYELLAKSLFEHLSTLETFVATEKTRKEYLVKGNVAVNSYQVSNDFLRLVVQLNNSYSTINQQTSILIEKIQKLELNYVAQSPNDVPLQVSRKHLYVEELLKNVLGLDIEAHTSIWVAFGEYLSEGCSILVKNYSDSLERAVNFYDGTLDEKTGFMYYFPAESYEEINTTLQKIVNDRKNLQVYHRAMISTGDFLKKNDMFSTSLTTVTDTIKTLADINTQGTDLWAKARDKTVIANREKADGDARYQQAQYNLKAGKFAEARQFLQRSRDQYNKYLEIQESPAFRKSSDDSLAKLNDEINFAESELVVREVRRLKNQARQAYQREEYDSAETILLQAQERWFSINIDPDEEIVQLLSLIGTALSMKVGRTIPQVAPLYPEMSQLFSNANQYYDKGKVLSEAGKKKEAEEVLLQAKAELRKMQVIYPINQDASFLLLKVDQLMNPEAFEESFKRKIQSAQTNYRIIERQQEAYLDLLDLYRINPSYPGLANLIYQVELYLGIRSPPPDRTAQNRAAELTRKARSALNSNDEVTIRAAIAQLDEAIRLDAQNEETYLIKDRLQIKVGGQTLSVLSSASEALYQKAVQELQNNNIINAATVLSQLLQDPNSRRSSKILDLEKRIKILTGQA
ncbi:MAG: hypothetical protein ACRC5H_10370 [Treponemataceae bacterium]